MGLALIELAYVRLRWQVSASTGGRPSFDVDPPGRVAVPMGTGLTWAFQSLLLGWIKSSDLGWPSAINEGRATFSGNDALTILSFVPLPFALPSLSLSVPMSYPYSERDISPRQRVV